jgi:DNA-binding LacI/PurR family transcriptional regulator
MAVLTKPTAKKRERIADDLRTLALTMAPGERFLSAPEIRKTYGVAAGTVEAAMETLRAEGLVTRRRGSGTFVSRPAPAALPRVTNVLAVLAGYAGDYQLPYVRRVQDELMAYAARRNTRVVQHYVGYAPPAAGEDARVDADETLGYAAEMAAFRPFGYLLLMYLQAPVAEELIRRGQRAVVLGVPPAGVRPAVPCVHGDHELGGYLAARHLIAHGHRRVAFAYSFHNPASVTGSHRWSGYRRAVREAGLPEIALHLDALNGNDALTAYFARPDAPTGITFWTDALAGDLVPRLRAVGLRVPEDVSVVGYDNTPLVGFSGPLDTIDQNLARQVEYAALILESDAPVAGPPPALVVAPSLVERGSVGPPRHSP